MKREQPCAARRLRYFDTPHRLRLVGAVKQLGADREPVLFQVGRQIIDSHPVDACRALVALHSHQRFLQVLTFDYCFHRRSRDRRAFETGCRRASFGLSGGSAWGFTPRAGARVQFALIFLPHGSREIAVLLTTSTVQAFDGTLPPTMASADFCPAVGPPCGGLSPVAGTRHRSPEVRPTAFAARPPNLPPRPLMTMDFAIISSLVRPGRPRYPVFVHRAAALLHAFFRPHLATTPLRFANPSPPSGWIEDFHLQAVVHTRHTEEAARPKARGRNFRWLQDRAGIASAIPALTSTRRQRSKPRCPSAPLQHPPAGTRRALGRLARFAAAQAAIRFPPAAARRLSPCSASSCSPSGRQPHRQRLPERLREYAPW